MKFFITLILHFFACISIAQAQRTCVTPITEEENLVAAPATSLGEGNSRDTLKNETIIIPVVVHILYKDGAQNISTAQVLSQIEALNKDFSRSNEDAINTPAVFKNLAADVKIRFCLAGSDPQGRYTDGIVRKYTNTSIFVADDAMKFSGSGGDNAWDSKRYLNIWVCKLFGRTLGYSSIPGSAADKDGVVISFDCFGTTGAAKAPFNKGRTATHEIGHWLGLKHIWGDAACGNDGVADTPPQKSYNTGCPSFPHMSSCSENAYGDLFMNFMDFSDDACMNMFTHGQKIRMRSLFALGGSKNSFLNSTACEAGKFEEIVIAEPVIPVAPISISVYPNPSVDKITIDIKHTDPVVSVSFRIININGSTMLSDKLVNQKSSINITSLPTGMYFMKIGEGTEAVTKKVFKQ